MAVEIIGKIVKFLPVVSGVSNNGEWTKQEFILETQGQYVKSVAITDFKDKANAVGFPVGSMVKVQLDIQGKEHNGRWFNSIVAWKIEAHGDETPAPRQPVRTQQATQPTAAASPPDFNYAPGDDDGSNDLPF